MHINTLCAEKDYRDNSNDSHAFISFMHNWNRRRPWKRYARRYRAGIYRGHEYRETIIDGFSPRQTVFNSLLQYGLPGLPAWTAGIGRNPLPPQRWPQDRLYKQIRRWKACVKLLERTLTNTSLFRSTGPQNLRHVCTIRNPPDLCRRWILDCHKNIYRQSSGYRHRYRKCPSIIATKKSGCTALLDGTEHNHPEKTVKRASYNGA